MAQFGLSGMVEQDKISTLVRKNVSSALHYSLIWYELMMVVIMTFKESCGLVFFNERGFVRSNMRFIRF